METIIQAALVTITQQGDIEVVVQSEGIYRQFGKHKVKVAPKKLTLRPAQVKLILDPKVRYTGDIDNQDKGSYNPVS